MKINNFLLCCLLFIILGVTNNIEVIISEKTIFVLAAFAAFIIIRLLHRSKIKYTYGYVSGMLDSLLIGVFGIFLFSLFSVISCSIQKLESGNDIKDLISKILILVPNGTVTLFFAGIGILGLSLILPLFFMKNKIPEKDIILDDGK